MPENEIFKSVEFDHKTTKIQYREYEPKLRVELTRLQGLLRKANFPVLVILTGNDLLGCSETLNLLYGWLDPRYLEANGFAEPTEDERERPLFWRYWHALVPKGKIGIFVRAWTAHSIVSRLRDQCDDSGLERMIKHSINFEKLLIDDGALVLKFWLHISKSELKKRLKAAEKNLDGSWRVHPQEQSIYQHYDSSREVVKKVLDQTGTEFAPWQVVESKNSRYRNLVVASSLLSALSERLEGNRENPVSGNPVLADIERNPPANILGSIDLSLSLSKAEYAKKLAFWQRKLYKLTHDAYEKGVSTVIVFEGWDAAGKGGIIRRLTAAIDASLYRVIPISAPTDQEHSYNYLWRFWKHLPRAGKLSIFDRSWHGRVLVERVENLASESEWMRAYKEINDFEEQLCEHGIVFLKFWIHIDPNEQLLRFSEREKVPFKRHKMSSEDYRNRRRWGDYEIAVNDMVRNTNTEHAQWQLIAGNNKWWARVEALKTVCKKLQKSL